MPPRLYENYTIAQRQALIERRDADEKLRMKAIVTDGLKEAESFNVRVV